jgi:hypothetical protein
METHPAFILSFYTNLFQDLADLFPDCDFHSDLDWIEESVSTDSFLFIKSMSGLGKAVESSLITARLLEVPDYFPLVEGSDLPVFLNSLFQTVFHESGLRRFSSESQDTDSHLDQCALTVLSLRQVLLAFSKLEDVEPDVDEADEINSFFERTTSLPTINLTRWEVQFARELLYELFCNEDGQLAAPLAQWVSNPFGNHGPGKVADRSEGVEKYHFGYIPGVDLQLYQLDRVNPVYAENIRLSRSLYSGCSSRLAIVPKDFRGHRLICIEPKEFMWAQQGLMRILFDMVHSSPLTRRSINFLNQKKSFDLSKNRKFSTIDLKDASDRVSKTLCRLLLPEKVFALLTRYRSRGVNLPGEPEPFHPETMFTMGNALCFPMETIVFWALTVTASIRQLIETRKIPDTALISVLVQRLYSDPYLKRRVRNRVFGDDIICRREYFDSTTDILERAGLVVNTAKSCHDTLVRESCGSWWYHDYDVRIVRFSHHRCQSTRAWLGFAENCKALYCNGFHRAAQAVVDLMANWHRVPTSHLGLPDRIDYGDLYRWNSQFQRVEVYYPSLEDEGQRKRLPSEFGLYGFFAKSATSVFQRDNEIVNWKWIALER